MKTYATGDAFERLYLAPQFERAGLFKLVRETHGGTEVLYPGSSVHVTPALFFPHVVFVDRDPAARRFFEEMDLVLGYVRQNKHYRRSPQIEFLPLDFLEPLPVREEGFDLLLSLYINGIAGACKKYLKKSGLLLTHGDSEDAVEAWNDPDYAPVGLVEYRVRQYQWSDHELTPPVPPKKRSSRAKKYLKRVNEGIEYIENESYLLFRKR